MTFVGQYSGSVRLFRQFDSSRLLILTGLLINVTIAREHMESSLRFDIAYWDEDVDADCRQHSPSLTHSTDVHYVTQLPRPVAF